MLISRTDWDRAFSGYYRGDTAFGVSMNDHTSLGIGGPADVVVSPADPVSMKNIVMILRRQKVPYISLGGGTNTLIRDAGIEGVVIKLKAFNRIEIIEETGAEAELFVEAGVPLQKLVNLCRDKGYAGMEGLVGIPGTIGGAICGNAGSYGCEIRALLSSVVVMRTDGTLERLKPEQLGFGYRSSGLLAQDIVMSANLKLMKDDAEAVSSRTEEYFNRKKAAQPIWEKSAGSVFKNPGKGSAGMMIDQAGCKGMRMGDIEVSALHANFFVNRGRGSSEDYLLLMDRVAEKVKERFHVDLEPEIRVIGKG